MDQHRPRPLPWVSGGTSCCGAGWGALGGWAYVRDLRADTRLPVPLMHLVTCPVSTLYAPGTFLVLSPQFKKASLYAVSVLSLGKSTNYS